jgi:hypothetical protein
MAEEKKESRKELTPEEKKLLHKEEYLLTEKQKDRIKGYLSSVTARNKSADLKRTQRMKTSLRPSRRKG